MLDPPPLMGEPRDHVCKKKRSPCQQDNDSQAGNATRSMDNLPEDICRRIHALMPLRDAACVACVSHTFMRSWRCLPNLTLSQESLGLDGDIDQNHERTRDLVSKVDHILKSHSGVGLKKLRLELFDCHKVDSCYINSWLQIAITAGIEELTIFLPHIPKEPFNFPCSLLFNGSDSPIRYLHIGICDFRPTAGLGSWRSLTTLYLSNVGIADDELECLLSSCAALECLGLRTCREIVCLKIPCVLQRLRFLGVKVCSKLQAIDSNAPNISTFHYCGRLLSISFGSALQVKIVDMECSDFRQSNIVCHAWSKVLSFAPNVETLVISSIDEMISTPMLPRKFLHLKYLLISLFGVEAISPAHDYLSLVSFLEASPRLETFIFKVRQPEMKHDSVIGDTSYLRRLPQQHNCLKSVSIVGFCSAKSLVELTCHVVENATSLERLTLDTTYGCRSSGGCTIDERQRSYNTGSDNITEPARHTCLRMKRDILMEVPRALLAIRTHIEGKIPPRVALKVVEPCSCCHAV